CSSTTVANTFTSFTLTLNVVLWSSSLALGGRVEEGGRAVAGLESPFCASPIRLNKNTTAVSARRAICLGSTKIMETSHLDAAGMPAPARDTSAGNGSPSAHTAPSSKCSFFQMGTVFFKVSISQRQASNAGP